MSFYSRNLLAATSLLILGGGSGTSLAQQSQPVPARAGEVVQGLIHREADERYRLSFGASGTAVVEVSGVPADCALQVGTQGFQESDSSPVDWTDGQPGQTIRHSFRVQAGRPGVVWVMLRTRMSGVSVGRWSGVACSGSGPYYTAPDRAGGSGGGPSSFEGRPVQPPIAFRLLAQVEGAPSAQAPAAPSQSGLSRGWPSGSNRQDSPSSGSQPLSKGWPGSPGRSASLRDDRLGFSLDYPDDWSVGPPEKGTYTLKPRDGDAQVTVTVVPKSTVPNSTSGQVLLRLHERLTDMGADLVTLGPAQFAGQTAAYASHTYDDRDARGRTVSFDHVQLVLDHGANYYLVAFVAPHDVFVQQTEAFKRVFNSWRFLR